MGLCYRAVFEMVLLAGRNCLEDFLGAYTPPFLPPPKMNEFPIHLDKNQKPRDEKPKDATSVPSGDVQKRNILWVTFSFFPITPSLWRMLNQLVTWFFNLAHCLPYSIKKILLDLCVSHTEFPIIGPLINCSAWFFMASLRFKGILKK